MIRLIFIVFALVLSHNVFAHSLSESECQTQDYFNTIKNQPAKLQDFLYRLPKGGDLHNHASGATYAENMLHYAKSDAFCINRTSYTVYADQNCKPQDLLNENIKNPQFKNAIIDAWSMRAYKAKNQVSHDHFFASFPKFGLIIDDHTAKVLSEIMERAGQQNEQYLELMMTIDKNASGKLAKQLGWQLDFAAMRKQLLAAGLDDIVKAMSTKLDRDEAKVRELLGCHTKQAKIGCGVKVRYLYQVLRMQAPEMVFAQLLAGFEVASRDKRILGINMVQQEDSPIAMRDYKLHMQMIAFLHQLYPQVHISLHAGELNSALVSPEGLRFHIHDAVKVAHANRIGHGVDIRHENNADELLNYMAKHQVLVEVNLSSNALILGIKGKQHPFPLYLKHGVPLALSTDDEGVNRSNLTQEYVQAVNHFKLSYIQLKQLVRNSIYYSFLPGKNLWKNANYKQVVAACQRNPLGTKTPSQRCRLYLQQNEKAKEQWELERRFNQFESGFQLKDCLCG